MGWSVQKVQDPELLIKSPSGRRSPISTPRFLRAIGKGRLTNPSQPGASSVQAATANVWKVYCERLEGDTAAMFVAGNEFSLSQEAAMSRRIKGCRPSELALVRSAARDHDLIRAEPPSRFLPREFPASGSKPAVGSSARRSISTSSLSGGPSNGKCLR